MVTGISLHNVKCSSKLHSCLPTINSQGYSKWLQSKSSILTGEVECRNTLY